MEVGIGKLLHWKNKTSLLDRWRNGQDLTDILNTWASEGSRIVLEDAIIADLMGRRDEASTKQAFKQCH